MVARRDPDHEPSTDDDLPDPEELPSGSNWGSLVRGIATAVAADALVTVPWVALAPRWRPQHVVLFFSWLLLGYNIAVGYVGGRAAARSGLSHNDGAAQWNMTLAVTLCSIVLELVTRRFLGIHPAEPLPSWSTLLAHLLLVASLVRFGFAIGTWSQAYREGRVTEEDEAGAE